MLDDLTGGHHDTDDLARRLPRSNHFILNSNFNVGPVCRGISLESETAPKTELYNSWALLPVDPSKNEDSGRELVRTGVKTGSEVFRLSLDVLPDFKLVGHYSSLRYTKCPDGAGSPVPINNLENGDGVSACVLNCVEGGQSVAEHEACLLPLCLDLFEQNTDRKHCGRCCCPSTGRSNPFPKAMFACAATPKLSRPEVERSNRQNKHCRSKKPAKPIPILTHPSYPIPRSQLSLVTASAQGALAC